jgi:hypothetical protein
MNLKTLASKGLLNLKDYVGQISKGLLEKAGLYRRRKTIKAGARIISGVDLPTGGGKRKKSTKTPYYPGRIVPKVKKLKLTGTKKFPFYFKAFVLGKLKIQVKVSTKVKAKKRVSTGFLAQITGIKLFRKMVKVLLRGTLLTKVMTSLRILYTKMFSLKQLWFVKGTKSFTYQVRQVLRGTKLFPHFNKYIIVGARTIKAVAQITIKGRIIKAIKLASNLRGRKDFAKFLYALGLLDVDKKRQPKRPTKN